MYVKQTDFERNYVRRIFEMHVLANLLLRLTVSTAPTGVLYSLRHGMRLQKRQISLMTISPEVREAMHTGIHLHIVHRISSNVNARENP